MSRVRSIQANIEARRKHKQRFIQLIGTPSSGIVALAGDGTVWQWGGEYGTWKDGSLTYKKRWIELKDDE